MEKWLTGQIQILDKQTKSQEPQYSEKETVKPMQTIAEEKQAISLEDKSIPEPFPTEKTKEKSKESDELQVSQSFEKALSSAIEKEKMKKPEPLEVKEKEPELQKTELKEEVEKLQLEPTVKIEETAKRKIKVRCPQCKNVFLTEFEGEIIKIKCPTCGKEGVIKQQL